MKPAVEGSGLSLPLCVTVVTWLCVVVIRVMACVSYVGLLSVVSVFVRVTWPMLKRPCIWLNVWTRLGVFSVRLTWVFVTLHVPENAWNCSMCGLLGLTCGSVGVNLVQVLLSSRM